jgi:hypothetical protein
MRWDLNLEDHVWILLHVLTLFKRQLSSGGTIVVMHISINYFRNTLEFA